VAQRRCSGAIPIRPTINGRRRGGRVAAWPLAARAARAQQTERVRRIGLLMGVADDPEGQARDASRAAA
jgi:hypothetical protein